jgi:hypothetical protein
MGEFTGLVRKNAHELSTVSTWLRVFQLPDSRRAESTRFAQPAGNCLAQDWHGKL